MGGAYGYNLGSAIKNGVVNVTLLKPYDIVFGEFIKEQAWKVISLIIVVPATLVVFYLFRDIIHIQLTPWNIPLLVVSLLFGGLIFAIIEAIMGILAFWLTEIWPLVMIREFTLSLFGAQLIPYPLMPVPIQVISNFLPFKYIFYTPLSIILHKTTNPILDISIQAFFVILLFILYKLIWRAGIKKYEAIGG